MKKMNILVTVRDNEKFVVVSNHNAFGIGRISIDNPMIVWSTKVPQWYDNSDISICCYNEMCKMGYGPDIEFDIFYNNDHVKISHGEIQDRVFEVYPMYMDDCTIAGDLQSETDSVGFKVTHPNGAERTFYNSSCQDIETLQNVLMEKGYVDRTCTVDIHDIDCNSFEVINGSFFPATIVRDDDV